MDWSNLVGKKIVALRGYKEDHFEVQRVSLNFILFDDEETYLELDEQSAYDYHDCCSSARSLYLHNDVKRWKKLFEKDGVEECNPGSDPFS